MCGYGRATTGFRRLLVAHEDAIAEKDAESGARLRELLRSAGVVVETAEEVTFSLAMLLPEVLLEQQDDDDDDGGEEEEKDGGGGDDDDDEEEE